MDKRVFMQSILVKLLDIEQDGRRVGVNRKCSAQACLKGVSFKEDSIWRLSVAMGAFLVRQSYEHDCFMSE